MMGINKACFELTETELLMYIPAAISAYFNVSHVSFSFAHLNCSNFNC